VPLVIPMLKKTSIRCIWLVLLLALPTLSFADARFKNINKEYGLPSSTVFSFLQDKQGYIWFASGNGLERYDGYKFTVFKHKPNDPDSISSDFVKTLYQDSTGRLWVGTYGGGLDLYQASTGTFVHYHHRDGDPNTPSSEKIFALQGDSQGHLLIGTFDAGLDVMDLATGRMRHFTTTDGSGLSNNRINSIFIDRRGVIWMATNHGLDEVDLTHGLIHAYFDKSGSDDNNIIFNITEDPQGELLLATVHGLHSFQPGTDLLDKSAILGLIPHEIAGKTSIGVFVDSKGNTWFTSASAGLSIIQHDSLAAMSFVPNRNNAASLSSQSIYSIYEDRAGLMWFGTDLGAESLDPRMLSLAYITPYELNGNPQSGLNHVEEVLVYGDATLISTTSDIYKIENSALGHQGSTTLFAHYDAGKYGAATSLQLGIDEHVLIGTNHNYLLNVDKHGHLQNTWHIGEGLGLSPVPIRGILQTPADTFYLATFGNGLLEYNSGTGETKRIYEDNATGLLKSDEVETILQLSSQKLLAGTFRGLFEVDLRSGGSSRVSLWKNAAEPVIQALYRDPKGNVWVGTYEGLWKLEFNEDGAVTAGKSYPQISNSTNAQVLAIEPDNHGNLWLASNNTLMRFNPDSGRLLTLGRDQGMPALEYYSYTHSKTPTGWIWFGGPSGVLGVNPDLIHPNLDAPEAVINGITTYEKDKPIDLRAPSGEALKLSYRDSIVTIDISGTDFAEPQANTYSYRLLGFRSEWTPPTTNHQITFTNLNPGRYRLEVRAANNWGTWSAKPASMDIIVLPPWWRTWWAYTLYFLIIIGSSIGYVRSLKHKIEREKGISASLREANEIKSNFVEKLQTQVAAATRELRETLQGVNLKNAELEVAQKRAAEGEQVKSQFLAHMSHELRTPLTGVLGYTKLLSSTTLNSEQKDYVGTIRQSSETLLAIINDTLDLSKLDAGKLLVDEVDFDLLEVIESTLELLAPTAYQKRLELIRVIPPDVPLQLRGDPLRLRQVLTNLLSNAIKFTESGAVAIQVSIVSDDEREVGLSIAVTDTGIGISEMELPKLFHAYARSRISTRQHVEGTGLGLAICKKLLDLMGGTIQVKSRVGSGTTFEFQLKFKLQKNAVPRTKLPMKLGILLYDRHPLSSLAWRASLTRLGAEVREVMDLESLISQKADAAVLALSERELAHLGELKQKFSPALPPMLILAPRIERQTLKDLSETLYHRVLSKSAREKTVYLELQSLVQAAIQPSQETENSKKTARVSPATDAPLVIVADDNRINRRLLVTMLNHAGFRTSEAGNGHELLDLAARGPWSAALLDIHMPGMDGIETANRLRAIYGESVAPIVAMSADVMPETRQQLEGVMDDFLVKPFSEQELVDKLRWHLDRHSRKNRSVTQLP